MHKWLACFVSVRRSWEKKLSFYMCFNLYTLICFYGNNANNVKIYSTLLLVLNNFFPKCSNKVSNLVLQCHLIRTDKSRHVFFSIRPPGQAYLIYIDSPKLKIQKKKYKSNNSIMTKICRLATRNSKIVNSTSSFVRYLFVPTSTNTTLCKWAVDAADCLLDSTYVVCHVSFSLNFTLEIIVGVFNQSRIDFDPAKKLIARKFTTEVNKKIAMAISCI
jgi:hypothetical protein